ncbi:hypothetical protein LENED_002025 [Lentinula edodes]|uniref:Uncharacterized protein n=1 Tax=Lentinula edodes TaxID=5353 RepID=A0A1Q3E016_LENED|nr:hypothetical protein LENED_002025 [Lentinula edodes]
MSSPTGNINGTSSPNQDPSMRIVPALLHLRWLDGLLTMFTTLRLFITEDIFLAPPMQMSFKDDLATKFLMGTFLLPLLNWNITIIL